MKKHLLILLLSFSSFAQNGLIARQNFGRSFSAPTFNTYTGGVSGSITSASNLATKLGISVGAISNFTVVGSDIKCKIIGSYVTPIDCFAYDTSLTYFNDNDGLVTDLGNNSFRGCTSFTGDIIFNGIITLTGSHVFRNNSIKKVELLNCTSITGTPFYNGEAPLTERVIYIPKVTSLGASSGDNSVFNGIESNSVIYAHPSLATNNSGAPDGDLAYAITRGASVRYVANYTAPSAITTLAAGTVYNTAIQLNFTPPSSTNTIDYYEVYVNGVYNNKFTGSTGYAISLTHSTSYSLTVKAVDVFYNKSTSNIVNASTSNYSYTDSDANASISAKSLTGSEQESEYRLIVDLKSNSLYVKCQALYTFKGTTSTQHKFNSKNPVDTDAGFRLVFSGGGTFSNSGYQCNGSNSFADTFFVPSANQDVNSNGLTIVSGTNNTETQSSAWAIGSYTTDTQASLLTPKNNNTTYNRYASLNSNANRTAQAGVNEAKGIFTGTRQSATVTKLFRNSSLLATGTGGGTLPTHKIIVGGFNYINTFTSATTQRIQMAIIHEGLSDAEVATLHSIIDLSESIAGRKTW